MEPHEEKTENEEDGSFGPLIAIIIIAVLLIIGGLFVFRKLNPERIIPIGSMAKKDAVVEMLSKQSTSNNLEDIKKDLSATSIDSVGSGLSPLK